jgi:transposase
MDKKERLDNKIKRFYRRAGHPRFWHRFGPKKFQTWTFVLAFSLQQNFHLSFRRVMRFLDEYYNIKLHWTTVQKAIKRLPKCLWQMLLQSTVTWSDCPIAAGDGTGFSRNLPSPYFLNRIDRTNSVGRPVQAITMIDVARRKFLSANIYAKPHHEVCQMPTVYRSASIRPQTLLLDKGYDAEWLHQWLYDEGTFAVIPARKRCRKGMRRKVMRDCIDWCLYWQRNIVECLFSALKRLYGASVRCRTIRMQSAEVFCRMILYNIGWLLRYFLHSHSQRHIYK